MCETTVEGFPWEVASIGAEYGCCAIEPPTAGSAGTEREIAMRAGGLMAQLRPGSRRLRSQAAGPPRSRFTVAGLSLLAALMVLLSACSGAGAAANTPRATATPDWGGPSMHERPAPPFTLQDQDGKQVTLESLRGHPVVLTFLDATCSEECPILVQYWNYTAQLLGATDTQKVVWLAMSVNPNNTPDEARAFLTKNHALMQVHFLFGTQAQLAPLWKAYYISVQPGESDVAHTAGLYVIDQAGRERAWLDAGFDPMALKNDLARLLASPGA